MKNAKVKLFTAFVSLIIAVVMIVGVSYAWLSMSSNPVAGNISIAISGGQTILLAQDITQTVSSEDDGSETVVHYPSAFSQTLEFSQENYSYLSDELELSPVSSADGISWLIPVYDEETGLLCDYTEFEADTSLEYANSDEDGRYIYIDFWVVSPASGCEIRVSMDTEDESGSCALSLSDDDGADVISASLRVGFLVNTSDAGEETLKAYEESEGYSKNYDSLAGVYAEQGEETEDTELYDFTVYEPNADLHPSGDISGYSVTYPLLYNSYTKEITQENITQSTAVQLESTLKSDGSISCGRFVRSTLALYGKTEEADADEVSFSGLTLQGSTDDVVIVTLERNVPQRIRMFIWIEGQDADCVNSGYISAQDISITIEIAGQTG